MGQRDTKRETQKTNCQTRQDGRTDGHMDRRRDRCSGCPRTTTRLLPHASAQHCAQNIDLLPPRVSCKWILSSFGNCRSQNITSQHFEVSNVLCRVPASKSHPLQKPLPGLAISCARYVQCNPPPDQIPSSKLLRHSMLMKYSPHRCCLDLPHFGTLILVGALLVDAVWLSVCSVMVDMMNTPILQCTTVARC